MTVNQRVTALISGKYFFEKLFQSIVRKRSFPKLRSFAEKRANFENPIESLFSSKRSHQLNYDAVSDIMGGPKADPDIVYKDKY